MKKFILPLSVFLFVGLFLSIVQVKFDKPIILLERFFENGGWIEVIVFACYGAIVSYNMQNPEKVPKWRLLTWSLFSVFFFLQFALGLLGFEKFLMTGVLHLPVPAMILGGPIYRFEVSFMTILFLSTIFLTGPAWCSHLCYFGVLDNHFAKNGTANKKIKNRRAIKFSFLFLIIIFSLLLRFIGFSSFYTIMFAISFGVIGIFIILFISRKKGKMVHCLAYCPIGTIVNFLSWLNPFRIKINDDCTMCMQCTPLCKYDALYHDDLKNRKPDITCTLCGDCMAVCKPNAIEYRFINMKAETARRFYLFLTISVHAIFFALARL